MEIERKTEMKIAWVKCILIALIFEKIVQHIFVSIAFYSNWKDIRSTVAVKPDILMMLGAILAVLFTMGLWAVITQKKWALKLVITLALFDIFGEFVAQGRIDIVITVSFIVATILFILGLSYHLPEPKRKEITKSETLL